MSGLGVQSGLTADPTVSFGDVEVGATAHRAVRVTNSGNAPLTLTGRKLAGSSAYSLEDPGDDECFVGTSIAVGDSCDVGVRFEPGSRGTSGASLTLSRSDGPVRVLALTGSGADVVAPTLVSRSPAPGASSVNVRTKVRVVFSEAVTGVDKTTFALTNLSTGRTVKTKLTRSGKRYVLAPKSNLPSGTRFRVTLVGGSHEIRDQSDVALRDSSWRFRTR